MPYPSLNEVNYTAFSEITEEYHNELYAFIEMNGKFGLFKQGKSTMLYKRCDKNGNIKPEQKTLTEYIRHQIHHPENTLNRRYTERELHTSIELMRTFIANNPV